MICFPVDVQNSIFECVLILSGGRLFLRSYKLNDEPGFRRGYHSSGQCFETGIAPKFGQLWSGIFLTDVYFLE
jgi:hypothetical protein